MSHVYINKLKQIKSQNSLNKSGIKSQRQLNDGKFKIDQNIKKIKEYIEFLRNIKTGKEGQDFFEIKYSPFKSQYLPANFFDYTKKNYNHNTGTLNFMESSAQTLNNNNNDINNKDQKQNIFIDNSQNKLKKFKNGIYYGQIQDDKRHGFGIFIQFNGRIYEGQWEMNEKSGLGYYIFIEGQVYDGEFKNGKKFGRGKLTWQNGDSYEGFWENNKKHGQGIWRSINGEMYEGNWSNDKGDGQGHHVWKNGDSYHGEFKNSLKHGNGEEFFNNGDYYKGEYRHGFPEGKGEYYWADGSYYKGDFEKGLRHGNGLWKSNINNENDCNTYQGQFVHDERSGKGEFVWSTGNRYEGDFYKNQRNGKGKMVWQDGSYYEGDWKDGMYEGFGIFQAPNQKQLKGPFIKNQFVGTVPPSPKQTKDAQCDIAFPNKMVSTFTETEQKKYKTAKVETEQKKFKDADVGTEQKNYKNAQVVTDQKTYKNAQMETEQKTYKNAQMETDQKKYKNAQMETEQKQFKNVEIETEKEKPKQVHNAAIGTDSVRKLDMEAQVDSDLSRLNRIKTQTEHQDDSYDCYKKCEYRDVDQSQLENGKKLLTESQLDEIKEQFTKEEDKPSKIKRQRGRTQSSVSLQQIQIQQQSQNSQQEQEQSQPEQFLEEDSYYSADFQKKVAKKKKKQKKQKKVKPQKRDKSWSEVILDDKLKFLKNSHNQSKSLTKRSKRNLTASFSLQKPKPFVAGSIIVQKIPEDQIPGTKSQTMKNSQILGKSMLSKKSKINNKSKSQFQSNHSLLDSYLGLKSQYQHFYELQCQNKNDNIDNLNDENNKETSQPKDKAKKIKNMQFFSTSPNRTIKAKKNFKIDKYDLLKFSNRMFMPCHKKEIKLLNEKKDKFKQQFIEIKQGEKKLQTKQEKQALKESLKKYNTIQSFDSKQQKKLVKEQIQIRKNPEKVVEKQLVKNEMKKLKQSGIKVAQKNNQMRNNNFDNNQNNTNNNNNSNFYERQTNISLYSPTTNQIFDHNNSLNWNTHQNQNYNQQTSNDTENTLKANGFTPNETNNKKLRSITHAKTPNNKNQQLVFNSNKSNKILNNNNYYNKSSLPNDSFFDPYSQQLVKTSRKIRPQSFHHQVTLNSKIYNRNQSFNGIDAKNNTYQNKNSKLLTIEPELYGKDLVINNTHKNSITTTNINSARPPILPKTLKNNRKLIQDHMKTINHEKIGNINIKGGEKDNYEQQKNKSLDTKSILNNTFNTRKKSQIKQIYTKDNLSMYMLNGQNNKIYNQNLNFMSQNSSLISNNNNNSINNNSGYKNKTMNAKNLTLQQQQEYQLQNSFQLPRRSSFAQKVLSYNGYQNGSLNQSEIKHNDSVLGKSFLDNSQFVKDNKILVDEYQNKLFKDSGKRASTSKNQSGSYYPQIIKN